MIHVLACVLVGVSWSLSRDPRVAVPSRRQRLAATPLWNQEQQRLDLLVKQPDWLEDTGPAHPCERGHGVPTEVWEALPPPFRDFVLHMRCRAFPLLGGRRQVCAGTPFLLLAVRSLVPHFERRQAIRETWGRTGTYGNRTVVTVFLLGSSSPSDHLPDLQGILGREAELHRDLLQWDYRDTVFNLTLKDVLFLDWFSQNCPHARFVLKGDDDVFVNTLGVLRFLEELPEDQEGDLFIGDVIAGPHRDRTLESSVPEDVFVGPYPPYAAGGCLLSGGVARRLSAVSRQVALFPIDDVYTGMCLWKLGIVPRKHAGFRTSGSEERSRESPCAYRSLLLLRSHTPQQTLRAWPWVANADSECQ